MSTATYLVAKYVPDLRRMEARNIGIIVWCSGEVAAHFLGERKDSGEVDGRSIPGFITSTSAYRQWVRYWRKELDKPALRFLQGGELAQRASPDFLKALTSSSHGNFHLVEGGMLLDPVSDDQLLDVVEYLFRSLVEETVSAEDGRDPTLDDVCRQLVEEAKLTSDPFFHRNYSVDCLVADSTREDFEFSFAYANGKPVRLYQQLPLPKTRRLLKRNVHHVAWMFEKAVQSALIESNQGGVLVLPTEEQLQDQEVNRSFKVLESITRVVNLQAKYDEFRRELLSLHALPLSATHEHEAL